MDLEANMTGMIFVADLNDFENGPIAKMVEGLNLSPGALDTIAKAAAKAYFDSAVKNCPYADDVEDERYGKGPLRDSFSTVQISVGVWGVATSQPDKLEYVINPTVKKGYMIYPRFKKALMWDELDHPVASARHPGHAGNAFLEEAEMDAIEVAEGIVFDFKVAAADSLTFEAQGRGSKWKSHGRYVAGPRI